MTLNELLDLWAARDIRYAVRTRMRAFQPLTQGELGALRTYRESEVFALPLSVQSVARAHLLRWTPPGRVR